MGTRRLAPDQPSSPAPITTSIPYRAPLSNYSPPRRGGFRIASDAIERPARGDTVFLGTIGDEDGEQWELIELPVILPSGESLFPGFWPIEELRRTRATLPTARWMANYQQTPTSDEGALIKREWWRDWPDHQTPPPIDVNGVGHGVFCGDECRSLGHGTVGNLRATRRRWNIQQGIILLDAFAARLDFPALKMKAVEMQDLWKPDYLLIENKGTGQR